MAVLDYKWGRQGLSEGSLDRQFPSWKYWKISERKTKRNAKTGAPLELWEVPWGIAVAPGAPWGSNFLHGSPGVFLQ